MVWVPNNTIIKTWKSPNEPFKLPSNCSDQCSMQSIGEKGKWKTVRTFLPEGNTDNTTMWRKIQTNNYRQTFASGSRSKEGPSETRGSRIHLLRYGENKRLSIEARRPDGHTCSQNRRKKVQFHTKIFLNPDPLKSTSTKFYLIHSLKQKAYLKEA